MQSSCLACATLVLALLWPATGSAQTLARVYSVGDRAFVELPGDASAAASEPGARRALGATRHVRYAVSRLPGARPLETPVRLFSTGRETCDGSLGAPMHLHESNPLWQRNRYYRTTVVAEVRACEPQAWVMAWLEPTAPSVGERIGGGPREAALLAQALGRMREHEYAKEWVAERRPNCRTPDRVIRRFWRVGHQRFVHVILELIGGGCRRLVVEADLSSDETGNTRCVPARPCVDDPLIIYPADEMHACPVAYDQYVRYLDLEGDGVPEVLQAWYAPYNELETVTTVHRLEADAGPLLESDSFDRVRGYRTAP